MTLIDRILGIWSGILLTALPIICLIIDAGKKLIMIIVLFVMLIYCIFMFFNVFKTYICLGTKENKLIIRETPGLKKEEFSLENILNIEVSDGIYTKEFFTIPAIFIFLQISFLCDILPLWHCYNLELVLKNLLLLTTLLFAFHNEDN